MSCRESRDDSVASPFRARSLLTVRAAISFALRFGVPRPSRLSSMCSYWRSRLALQASCGMTAPFALCEAGTRRRSALFQRRVLDVVVVRVALRELVHDVHPVAVRVVDLHERLPLVGERVLR